MVVRLELTDKDAKILHDHLVGLVNMMESFKECGQSYGDSKTIEYVINSLNLKLKKEIKGGKG